MPGREGGEGREGDADGALRGDLSARHSTVPGARVPRAEGQGPGNVTGEKVFVLRL